jgi:hypothetical protein
MKSDVEIEAGILRPFLLGEDVHWYDMPNANHFCIYPYELKDCKTRILEEVELRKRFPRCYAYLNQFREVLTEVRKRQKTNPKYWYSCHRSRDMRVFESDRIISQEISFGCNMTVARAGLYHNTMVYSLVPHPARKEHRLFWLGVLNSRTMWWYLSKTGNVLRGGYFRFKTNYISPFPIPVIDFTNPSDKSRHDRIVTLVERMLALHAQLAKAKVPGDRAALQDQIDATDREIDRLVYDLYSLTEEEIAIVEGNAESAP